MWRSRPGKQRQGQARVSGKFVQPAWTPPAEVKADNPALPDVIPGGAPNGSVRSCASPYRLSWNEANPGSCRLQDGQHGHGPLEVEESAAIGGNVLVVAGARAEDVAQFIVSATEPSGRS